MPGNLKVAFDFDDKEGTVMVTVAEDECDPAYKVLQKGTQILSLEEDGRDWVLQSMDLPQILEVIPVFLAKARTKWETEPRYMKYAKPRAPRAKKGEATNPPPAEEAAAQSTGELPLLAQPSESGDEATAESPDPEGVAQAVEASAEAPPAPQASEEPAPAPSPSSNGSAKWVYKVYRREGEIMLLSGGHPPEDAEDDSWTCSTYSSTHDALRDLGVTQEEIDKHKYWHRWDRLPFSHQRRIEKVAI